MVEVAEKKRATRRRKRQRTENHEVATTGKMKKTTRGRKKQRIVNHDDGRRGWSDLPKELVELFMRRLLYIDRIYIGATCKSWHSVARVPISPQKKQLPWLLGIDHKSSWTSCKLSNPTYKKTYTIDMSPLQIRALQIKEINAGKCRLHVHESKSGWLLLSASSVGKHHFIMYSPFLTRDNLLELPVLTTNILILATFSHSNKYDNFSSSYHYGFSFIALSYGSTWHYGLKISTCKWGDDTWTTSREIHCHYPLLGITWLYSQGRFYYATKFGQVGSLIVDGLEWGALPPLDRLLNNDKHVRMTMSDEGELYIFTVCVEYSLDRFKSGPIYLDAYRLNLCSQQQYTTTWECIERLGQDQALFLDRSCKLSTKLISNTPREMANRVYYCSGKAGLRTARHTIRNNSSRSYSCLKHFGSFSKEIRYIKLWVEPPEY